MRFPRITFPVASVLDLDDLDPMSLIPGDQVPRAGQRSADGVRRGTEDLDSLGIRLRVRPRGVGADLVPRHQVRAAPFKHDPGAREPRDDQPPNNARSSRENQAIAMSPGLRAVDLDQVRSGVCPAGSCRRSPAGLVISGSGLVSVMT